MYIKSIFGNLLILVSIFREWVFEKKSPYLSRKPSLISFKHSKFRGIGFQFVQFFV